MDATGRRPGRDRRRDTLRHSPGPQSAEAQAQTALASEPGESTPADDSRTSSSARGWSWGTAVLPAIAVLAVALAGTVQWHPNAIKGLLSQMVGPPRVVLREAYADNPSGPHFDHEELDKLLKAHVSEDGWVDYPGLGRDAARLDAYLAQVADAPFDAMGRDEKLALLINAYNAFTLRLILEHFPIDSIRSIRPSDRWDAVRWRLGSHTWSLNKIEHEQIRPRFREPRAHFALVCAAVGCPPLRSEAYSADRLDEQLEDQARSVHGHDRWLRMEPGGDTVWLTRLYQWYGNDFEQVAGSVPAFAGALRAGPEGGAGCRPDTRHSLARIRLALNSRENRR